MVEATGGQDDAAAGADPHRRAGPLDHRTDDSAVDVGDQFGHRRVQPQRDVSFLHRQPQPGGQRLADGRDAVAEHVGTKLAPQQLEQDHLAAPVLPHLVEQPKILGPQPDSLGRQCQRLEQVAFLVAEGAQIDRRDVDGATKSDPPGSSG